MKPFRWKALVALLVLMANAATSPPGVADAQSLFENRNDNRVDCYQNFTARKRGDTIAIVIVENTDIENRDQRRMDKAGASLSSQGFDYALSGDVGGAAGDLQVSTNSEHARDFRGDAQYRSERELNDRISVTVVDVLPNGNMVVEGSRTISLQGDVRCLKITGTVRQFDVLPNNSVPSYKVADMKLTIDATGAEQAFTSQGWLSRRFNRWWPF